MKLSLNFQLAATQKKINKNRLFDENIKILCDNFFKVIYISIIMIFKMLYKAIILKVFPSSIVHLYQTVETYYGPYFLSHTVYIERETKMQSDHTAERPRQK